MRHHRSCLHKQRPSHSSNKSRLRGIPSPSREPHELTLEHLRTRKLRLIRLSRKRLQIPLSNFPLRHRIAQLYPPTMQRIVARNYTYYVGSLYGVSPESCFCCNATVTTVATTAQSNNIADTTPTTTANRSGGLSESDRMALGTTVVLGLGCRRFWWR